jgi:two-component system NtrC family sensor kinase
MSDAGRAEPQARAMWRLQRFAEVACDQAGRLHTDAGLEELLKALLRLLSADWVDLRFNDPAAGGLVVRLAVGATPHHATTIATSEAWRWAAERAYRARRPVVFDEPGDGGEGNTLPIQSVISAPIWSAAEVVGTVTAGSVSPRQFTSHDAASLHAAGWRIGLSLQNAGLSATIQRAKREWERTCDAVDDPIVAFDRRGGVLRANRALERLTGWPFTTLRGRGCSDLGFCGNHCREECAVARAARTGEEATFETARADGRIFGVVVSPIEHGDEVAVVMAARDVTEERRAAHELQAMTHSVMRTNEELLAALENLKSVHTQLIHSERLAALGELVGGVAHEINNPLTSVLGYAELVERSLRSLPATDAEAKRTIDHVARDLRRIIAEGERAAGVIRNLLTFARRTAGERSWRQLDQLLDEVLSLRANEHRLLEVQLNVEYDKTAPPVWCDADAIRQAALALLLNAEQALALRPSPRTLQLGVHFDPAAHGVVLHVGDNGPGIDPAHAARVFDPFYTTRPAGHGRGLGLTTAYGITRDHGGEIWIDSAPGVGASACLMLPARMPGDPSARPAALVGHAQRPMREFLAAMLSGWGYRVETAATRNAALDLYRGESIGAALLHQSVVEGDLAAWRLAARYGPRRAPIVLVADAHPNPDVDAAARELAAAVASPPYNLAAVRAALVAAEQSSS